MSSLQEQLDAVKEQLVFEDNVDLRQQVFGVYLQEPEEGANMIINFANRDEETLPNASSDDVIRLEFQAIAEMMSYDMRTSRGKLTPEELRVLAKYGIGNDEISEFMGGSGYGGGTVSPDQFANLFRQVFLLRVLYHRLVKMLLSSQRKEQMIMNYMKYGDELYEN